MPTLKLGIDARGAKRGADQFTTATRRTTDGADRTGRSVKKLDDGMSRMGSTATRVAGLVSAAFTAIGAGIGIRGAIKTIASFEETLATLEAVTGANDVSMRALQDTARELGAVTKFSATEAGEGLVFLARAGFSADAAIAALPSTLDLAAAGALQLGESADIASNVLSQFGLTADEMERVADTLTKTANSSNTDVRQLAEAMKYVGPVAGALGISIEETASAIGVLGDSGVQGSMAGTNLRGVFSGLLGPTDKARRAIEEMGLSLKDLDPATHSISDIMDQFASKNLTAAQAVEIFGRRNAAAALILTRGTEKIRELAGANEEAASAAEKAAAIMNDTLTGAFKALNSAIEESYLRLGESFLLKSLRNLVDGATDVIRVMLGMEDQLNGDVAAAKEMTSTVQGLSASIAVLLAFKLAGFFNSAAAAVIRFTIALAANPIGLIAVALAAAVGLLVKFKDEMVNVGGQSLRVGVIVAAAFDVIGERVSIVFHAIYDIAKWGLDNVISFFKQVGDNVAAVAHAMGISWGDVLDFFLDITKRAINWVIGYFVFMGKEIKAAFNLIKDQVKTIIDTVSEVVSAIGDIDLLSPIESATRLNNAKDRIALLLFGGTAANLANAGRQTAINAAESFTTDYVGAVISALPKIKTGLKIAISQIIGTDRTSELFKALDVTTLLDDILARAGNLQLKEMAEGKKELTEVGKDLSVGVKTEKDALEEFNNELETSADLTEDLATKTVELTAAQKRIGDAFSDVGRAFSTTLEDIVFEFESVGQALKDLATNINRIIFDTFVSSPIRDFFSGLPGILGLVPSANGNVFSGGTIVPHADGGVVSSPSAFPMSDGRIGTVAEVAPEAIVPLERINGKLGVNTTGGGGKSVTVNMTVVTNDADSFRRSQRQIMEDLRRGVS